MNKRIIFIINPISGKGKGRIIEPEIINFFKDLSFEIETIFAEYAGHAKEITKEVINKKPDIIVACGGDGTINEIAQELIGKDIPLGIIAIGSGNGLASNLNIPKEINPALENIIVNQSSLIDVGKVNDKYFFSNIGLGIDAHVIDRYTVKKQRNFIGYLKASLWSFVNYKPVKYKVNFIDEELALNEYFLIFCSNSNIAGYGISFTPNASLKDGKIDVLCVSKLNFIGLIQFGYAVLFKTLDKFSKAELKQVNNVIFSSNNKNVQVQIDGEAFLLDTNKIEVSVLPKSLKVIMPN